MRPFRHARLHDPALAPGIERLRALCFEAGLTEVAKWGHPCYMRGERNIAMIATLIGDFRLHFFEPGLMKDPAVVLVPNGPNARRPSIIRFTANERVAELEPDIRAYLKEAIGYADQGLRQPKDAIEIELPDELVEALDTDPELAEAFHALTPGRQRSYVFAVNGASNRRPASPALPSTATASSPGREHRALAFGRMAANDRARLPGVRTARQRGCAMAGLSKYSE